jgi:hypothetical protein
MREPGPIRGGMVGAGRSRNGLGPFLASHFEAAGGEVVAIAGRDQARAAHAAAALATRLGHPVRAHGSLAGLLAEELDGLIIAAPGPVHLPALQAALGAGVPVLCEKPLVGRRQGDRVEALVEGFAARRLLLMENCQWPLVLDAWRQLFPAAAAAAAGPVGELAMRLSPMVPGPEMLEDSLSHLLSVAQELFEVDASTRISALHFAGRSGDDGLVCSFVLTTRAHALACRLELKACAEQPRPAWLAIDGNRMDRQIDLADYRISFCSGTRTVSVGDPAAALVYRFAQAIREPHDHERIRIESERVRHRARIYHFILDGCERHLGGQDGHAVG